MDVLKFKQPVSPRRIHVDGYHHSDYHLAVAVMQFDTGQIGLAVDGVEPTFENLVKIHQLLCVVSNELDNKIQKQALTPAREG